MARVLILAVMVVAVVAIPFLVMRRLGPPLPATDAWRELWTHHRAGAEIVVPLGEAVFLVLWCWFGVSAVSAVAGRRRGDAASLPDVTEAPPSTAPACVVPTRRRDPSAVPLRPADGSLDPVAWPTTAGVWQELPWAEEVRVEDEPVPNGPVVATLDAQLDPEPDWDVLVTVMGLVSAVDRDGRPASFEKSKSLELLVWLTQHRERPTRGAARTALWDAAVRDSTFANVVSDLRRGLARLCPPPDGDEWIGRTLTDDLPLHPRVRTDADLLQARLVASRGCDDARAAELLRPGLTLVTGMPFSGAGTSFTWADGEGHTSSVVLTITTAATELAERLLRLDDIDGVFWATGQGLKVLPGHEELIALRMQAHAARGDLAGVRLEWDQYERSLGADPWEQAAPSPKLTSLRRSLLTAAG